MTTDAGIARILVPTDFSSGSERAFSLAQRLAPSVGAELVLLHVLPATPLDTELRIQDEERRAELRSLQAEHQLGIPRADEEGEVPPPGRVSAAGREWARKLEEWADAGRASGCRVRTLLRVGVPYREVVAAATEERADLVLLATHGRGEIHRLLVGSVADRVIRLAPCPVLTVKGA